MKYLLFTISVCFFLACSGTKEAGATKEASNLQSIMSGSYNSSAQALTDSTYLDISMHIYPIWKNKKGLWLYVEQGMTSKPEKPYRQRIYKIDEIRKGQFVSRVYKIEDAERFVGKWQDPSFFKKFKEDILSEREGCEVYLNETSLGTYEGSTKNQNCSSKLGGAVYATSHVTITRNSISSWDRGFDSKDNQAWGAVKGPYVFIKI